MKYTAWRKSNRLEKQFREALYTLVEMFTKIARKTGHSEVQYYKAMKDFQETPAYNRYITSVVRRMVIPLNKAAARTWREAAKKSTMGYMIYKSLKDEYDTFDKELIEAQIVENVNLIKTLPTDVADKVVRDIQKATIEGKRADEIETLIVDKTSQHSRASARLIARTEVAKTQTNLIKMRSEQLELKWYIWRTALDGDRVRKSHQIMEGVVCSWNEAPSPERLVNEPYVGNYHPGQIWNCRCYPEPVVELEQLKFPVKVYRQGQIQRLTKAQFLELF